MVFKHKHLHEKGQKLITINDVTIISLKNTSNDESLIILMLLVPKVPHPKMSLDYHLINFCHVVIKLVTTVYR